VTPSETQDIVDALARGDYPDVPAPDLAEAAQAIAVEIASATSTLDKHVVRTIVDTFRRHRHFDLVQSVGQAWMTREAGDPVIQRLLAQATVELGGLDQAQILLNEVQRGAEADPADLEYVRQGADYHGLRGRIRKQRYVRTQDVNELRAAVDCYRKQSDASPSFFLDVNVLALRTRLLDEIGADPYDPPLREFARSVLEQAKTKAAADADDPWARSTASEASLALNRLEPGNAWCDQAELWLYRFLLHPRCGPFEVESYYRQVREIWKGNPLADTCSGRLARIFDQHVLRTQRRWSANAWQLQRLRDHPDQLEKNFSGEKMFTVGDIRKMLDVCPNVGCVVDDNGVRQGTGFLVKGDVFSISHPLLFVTNAHVISDDVTNAVSPGKARVTFQTELAAGRPSSHAISQVLFTSQPGELGKVEQEPRNLDVTVCLLGSTPAGSTGLAVSNATPWPSAKTKVFVVGHPRTGELQFSLQDSTLLDVCPQERLMHYRTPTDPGSSGSPVFNRDWEVVALHHAGSRACPRFVGQGTYEANEGITLRAIRRGMAETTRH